VLSIFTSFFKIKKVNIYSIMSLLWINVDNIDANIILKSSIKQIFIYNFENFYRKQNE